MNTLSVNLKTHKIIFKAETRGEAPRSPILITSKKADHLRVLLQKQGVKFIDLTDDDGQYLETLPVRIIDGIQPIGEASQSTSGYNFICDYGSRHPLGGPEGFSVCKCADRFGHRPVRFFRYMMFKFGIKTKADITEAMQVHYLSRPPEEIEKYVQEQMELLQEEKLQQAKANKVSLKSE